MGLAGAKLSGGSAPMGFKMRGPEGGTVWSHAALRDASGHVTAFDGDQVDFAPRRTWRSPRSGASYPVSETVRTGALTWQLDPLMDDQELDSSQSTGAVYWEGAVLVSRDGKALGHAFLELTGYGKALKLER